MMTKEDLSEFFDSYVRAMNSMMSKKNHDYASNEDAFANLNMCEQMGIAASEKGILIRITDKLSRVIQLLDKEAEVKDESFYDTCLDASIYFGLLAARFSERRFPPKWFPDPFSMSDLQSLNKVKPPIDTEATEKFSAE